MMKAIKEIDKGLDIMKFGLELQKRAVKLLLEKKKKD